MTEREAGDWPLGVLVKQAREAAGFSVREAAKAAGFAPTTWSSIESGTRVARDSGEHEPVKPRAENIISAAEVVGLDANEALRMAGYPLRGHAPPLRGRPTVSQQALLQRIGQLTEKQRQAVNDVVEAMLAPDGEWADLEPGAGQQPPSYAYPDVEPGTYEEVAEERSG